MFTDRISTIPASSNKKERRNSDVTKIFIKTNSETKIEPAVDENETLENTYDLWRHGPTNSKEEKCDEEVRPPTLLSKNRNVSSASGTADIIAEAALWLDTGASIQEMRMQR